MCVFDKFYVLFCFIGLVGHNIEVEKHAYNNSTQILISYKYGGTVLTEINGFCC